MSKKDEALELFRQGKKPGDVELDALLLKRDTVRKYFKVWEAQTISQEIPEPTAVADQGHRQARRAAHVPAPIAPRPVVKEETKPQPKRAKQFTMGHRQARRAAYVPRPIEVPVAEESIEEVVEETAIDTGLQPGQIFKRDGNSYRVRAVGAEYITAMFLEWAPSGQFQVEKYPVRLPLEVVMKSR